MELYRFRRTDILGCIKASRAVAAQTGQSVLYHLVDFLTSVVLYGVDPQQYSAGGFYRLPRFLRKKTYTLQRSNKLCKAFNDKSYRHLLRNKEEFDALFSRFISRGWMHCKNASAEEIAAFLRRYGRVIAKPGNSEKGQGIYSLEYNEQTVAEVSGSLAGQDILLEEWLTQHPQMCFGNHSINTVRYNTVLDAGGEVHLISTSLRCGVGDAIVDNYSGGGVVYPLDNKLGRINGPGKSLKLGLYIYTHPGTDIFMLGRVIPYWNEALEIVMAAAKVVPQIRLVGWDVAILENGPELIEGNTRPGENLFETQGEGERGVYRKVWSFYK